MMCSYARVEMAQALPTCTSTQAKLTCWDSWSIADTQKQRVQEKELEEDMKVVDDIKVVN